MATIQYKPLPELDEASKAKFWGKVATGADDACWPWTGGCFATDYGCFPVNRRSYYAHRYALALSSGIDPVGLVVCHRCDNPRCCNPAHLFAGTHQDNVQDMLSKGRGPTAEQRWASRAEWRAERKEKRRLEKEARQPKLRSLAASTLTPATRDYLLSIAIERRDAAAHAMMEHGHETSAAWGQAAAAVRELLEMPTTAAAALNALRRTRTGGRNGGRPRTAPRCACGQMTLKRAEQRNHKC